MLAVILFSGICETVVGVFISYYHTMVIEEGDSIYFDSEYPHAMVAVGSEPVKLIVVVIK